MNTLQTLIEYCEVVSKGLGRGLSETIYQEALCVLLRNNNMKYSKEHNLPVSFYESVVGFVRADITLPEHQTVIECKAINDLAESHLPQIVVYMEILNYSSGLFVNFVQNPAKTNLQIKKVSKISENVYMFEDPYSNINTFLSKTGDKIVMDTTCKEIEWVKNNIVYSEDAILYKKECQKLFIDIFKNQNSAAFIKLIETHCNCNFKDKQCKGIKHNACIFNYQIKTN